MIPAGYSIVALLAVIPIARWLYRDSLGDAAMLPGLSKRGAIVVALVECYAWPVFLAGWLLWRIARSLSHFVAAPNEQEGKHGG